MAGQTIPVGTSEKSEYGGLTIAKTFKKLPPTQPQGATQENSIANSPTPERLMPENRKYTRTASLQRCAVVSPTLGISCPARIINQSPDGLLLELDCEIAVSDVPVNIYLADEIRGTIDYESGTFLTGFIRWCKKDTDGWSGFYQAGIQLVTTAPRKDWR